MTIRVLQILDHSMGRRWAERLSHPRAGWFFQQTPKESLGNRVFTSAGHGNRLNFLFWSTAASFGVFGTHLLVYFVDFDALIRVGGTPNPCS